MAFVGEVEHLRRYTQPLQGREELKSLRHIQPVVELAVNHQRRRFKVCREQMRRPLAVQLAAGVGRTLELPLVGPQLFRGTPGRFSVEYAIVRHDALEAISVAEDPVGHVSAVTGAQRALTVFIDKRIVLLGVVEPLHQVFKRSTAPIAIDRVNELLPVAGEPWKLMNTTTYPFAANSSKFKR